MWDDVAAPERSVATPPPRDREKRRSRKRSRRHDAKPRRTVDEDDDFDVDVDESDGDVGEMDDDDDVRKPSRMLRRSTVGTVGSVDGNRRVQTVHVDIGAQIAEAEEEAENSVRVAVSGEELMQSFTGPEECACCLFELGKPPNRDNNPMHALLHDFYEENRCYMSLPMLCQQMVKFYHERIRTRLRDDGVEMPEWTPAMVQKHLVAHITDYAHATEMMLRETRMTKNQVRDTIFSRKETGAIDIDVEKAKLLLVYSKRESELFRDKERMRESHR